MYVARGDGFQEVLVGLYPIAFECVIGARGRKSDGYLGVNAAQGGDGCNVAGLFFLRVFREVDVHEHEIEKARHIGGCEIVGVHKRDCRCFERCVIYEVQQAFGVAGIVLAYCNVEVVHYRSLSLVCSCVALVFSIFRTSQKRYLSSTNNATKEAVLGGDFVRPIGCCTLPFSYVDIARLLRKGIALHV